ncbi:CIC11C00000004888 [Sungouiella intermedia]|uniref:CIC11C00000004888 n=1 Tax=Sungouiella intermedia TaxID=45354 RepID=A0A1L0DQT0_9ASCO|nr:CIC11C00000004888 [[Candida] intermedia]
MTTTYFITGANRGIGYELAKKISENKDNVVVATTRSWARAEQLKELKRSNLEIIQLDVTHSVDQLKAALGKLKILQENGVDVFIQNAGRCKHCHSPIEHYTDLFNANTLSGIKVYQAIYPYWIRENKGVTKKAVYVSSIVASMTGFIFPSFGYGLSKSALNFHAKHTAFENSNSENPVLKESITISLHPGVVATDMGSAAIEKFRQNGGAIGLDLDKMVISPPHSASDIVKVIDGLKLEDTGSFISHDGAKIPF